MQKITIGILAHVDAGKTTLSEALMFTGGAIRRQGRVDTKDAFLDTFMVEKQRGITVFSKCARIDVADGEKQIILIDTPGHVDFCAEAERTIAILDAAILVINGSDGVCAHTKDLWKLLRENHVPTFVFVNKTDMAGFDKAKTARQMSMQLADAIVDCSRPIEETAEDLASCDEDMMNAYLENGCISDALLSQKIMEEAAFPCYYGSALNNEGVSSLLDAIVMYVDCRLKDADSVRYKISYDDKGNRLTHIRVGKAGLEAKSILFGEKINEIRMYNGAKYETIKNAQPGDICAITGLTTSLEIANAHFKPVLSYAVCYPDGTDPHKMLDIMKKIEDEQPECSVRFRESTGDIEIMLMGEIQTEILTHLVSERYGVKVTFANPRIAYKETISGSVTGIGHYEPLKHFADVRLRIESLKRGSGVVTQSEVSEDVLDRNWQRLILTHLNEKEHIGVLTGSPITDVKITLTDGKAHLKHTEGGDFRKATYRAVRQGLMKAESHLLEPYYEYRLTIPDNCVGRAINDIQGMCGTYEVEAGSDGTTSIMGRVPVATMNGYALTVASYTSGKGILELSITGYEDCHNEAEIIEQVGYDPEADTDNPVHSIFCSHGAGHVVRWDELG